MDFGIACDSCQSSFDLQHKIPLLLPQCGCTVCKECAQIIQSKPLNPYPFLIGDSYCKKCNLPQTIDDFSSLRINQKIYAFVTLTQQNMNKTDSNTETVPSQPQQQQTPIAPKAPIYSFQSFNNQREQQPKSNADNMKVAYQYLMQSPGSRVQSATKRSEGTTQQSSDKLNHSQSNDDKSNSKKTLSDPTFKESGRSTLSNIKLQHQQTLSKRQFCKMHLDKPIEYFCQQCFKTVCSKCMFHHHNGHELTQIDDALKVFLAKLTTFDGKVKEVNKEHEDLKGQLMSHKSEIESMKAKQLKIIDLRFQELMMKLEERKQQLSKDILTKYENSLFKVNDRLRSCKEQSDELMNLQNTYSQMMSKLSSDHIINQEGTTEQIEILNQVPDYDKIIYENTLKIKNFQLSQKNTKLEIQGNDILGLRPIEVTVQNALQLIQTIQFDNMASTALQQVSQFFKKKTTMTVSTPQNHVSIFPNNQEETKSEVIGQGNSSFNFPRGQAFSTTQGSLSGSFSVKQQPSIFQASAVSIPTQILQQASPFKTSHFDALPIPPQQQMNDSRTDSQQSFNSKFARLKFNRQGTNNSQELCLQLDQIQPQVKEEPFINNEIAQQIVLPPQIKYDVDLKSEEDDQEEIISQKVRILDNAVYFVGDSRFILMFDYKGSQWNQIYYDKKESDYQGTLKFMSICQINQKKREFIMTGGCNKITKEPSNQCFRFSIPNIRVFREVQRMKNARYGHTSVYINQLVLIMGGFNHRDDEAEAPNTLNSCEKYSLKENEWTHIAPMQQERAYFSACRVKEEFVYVFGGFQNYETSNSIEFYNIMLDKWTLLSITMPLKIAKYGLAKIEENQIVIAGGLLVDNASTRSAAETASYSCVNTVYKFDCNTLKWTKLAKLNFRRTLYSNMAVKENGQIFAIGGTVEGINEVYDIRKKKWNTCQSYTSIMGQNDLQTYAMCSLSRFNDE